MFRNAVANYFEMKRKCSAINYGLYFIAQTATKSIPGLRITSAEDQQPAMPYYYFQLSFCYQYGSKYLKTLQNMQSKIKVPKKAIAQPCVCESGSPCTRKEDPAEEAPTSGDRNMGLGIRLRSCSHSRQDAINATVLLDTRRHQMGTD